jgi:hypothetical protein
VEVEILKGQIAAPCWPFPEDESQPASNHTTGVVNRLRSGSKQKVVAEAEHDSGCSSSSSGSSGSSGENEGQGTSGDSNSEGDDDGASKRDGSGMYCKIGFNPI